MARELGELLGATSILGWLLSGVFLMAITFMLPVMALIVTWNIRGIRRQLERLNNTLETRPGVTSTGSLRI